MEERMALGSGCPCEHCQGASIPQPLAPSVASSGGNKQACLPQLGLLDLGQNLAKLGVRVGCQGDCLSLEDECFHWFNWEGGRRAPGLAKYYILAKIV